jgi:hypothetical protein
MACRPLDTSAGGPSKAVAQSAKLTAQHESASGARPAERPGPRSLVTGESADEVARRWNMRAGRSYDPVPVDGDALERITRVLRLAGALLESAS